MPQRRWLIALLQALLWSIRMWPMPCLAQARTSLLQSGITTALRLLRRWSGTAGGLVIRPQVIRRKSSVNRCFIRRNNSANRISHLKLWFLLWFRRPAFSCWWFWLAIRVGWHWKWWCECFFVWNCVYISSTLFVWVEKCILLIFSGVSGLEGEKHPLLWLMKKCACYYYINLQQM